MTKFSGGQVVLSTQLSTYPCIIYLFNGLESHYQNPLSKCDFDENIVDHHYSTAAADQSMMNVILNCNNYRKAPSKMKYYSCNPLPSYYTGP